MASRRSNIATTTTIAFQDPPQTPLDPFPHLPPYRDPTTGLLSHVPRGLIPYLQLMRVDKPAGYYTFYFPHLYGTLYASLLLPSATHPNPKIPSTTPSPTLPHLMYVNGIFIIGSIFLRGAACTWNDTIDYPLDRQVARCRHRPIARGTISPNTANTFTAFQSLFGLLFLYLLPNAFLSTLYAFPLVVMIGYYPFAKRFTNYPQAILGFTLGLGHLVGAAAMGLNPLNMVTVKKDYGTMGGIACFYLANVLSAVVVDAVYAHQDVKDDMKAGVKSIAVAWQERTKPLLWSLSSIQVLLLASAGWFWGLGFGYHLITVLGTAIHLGAMVKSVKLELPKSCWWWFRYSIGFTGLTVGGGLFSEYMMLKT